MAEGDLGQLRDRVDEQRQVVDIEVVAGIVAEAGGMGGCPYAPGAPGNLATEALVEHLANRDITTGIDAEAVRQAVATLVASPRDPTIPA